MAVNLSPVGGVAAQFFTNTGAVLTGGKLYTYAAGTTTPATTFTSSNGGVAWTNPIVLDAAGRVPSGGEIWLTDGINYKFVLKDSTDVLIATYDNITGINSNSVSFTNQQQIITATAGQTVFNLSISYQPATNSLSVFVDGVNQYGPGAQYAYIETDSDTVTFVSGLHVGAQVKFTTTQQQGAGAVNASQVTYDPAGTGAVATNVQAKLRQIVSVADFGASTSATASANVTAIQNAVNTGAGTIYFPAGTYQINNTINFSPKQRLIGESARTVQIVQTDNTKFAFQGTAVPDTGPEWYNGGIQYAHGCVQGFDIRARYGVAINSVNLANPATLDYPNNAAFMAANIPVMGFVVKECIFIEDVVYANGAAWMAAQPTYNTFNIPTLPQLYTAGIGVLYSNVYEGIVEDCTFLYYGCAVLFFGADISECRNSRFGTNLRHGWTYEGSGVFPSGHQTKWVHNDMLSNYSIGGIKIEGAASVVDNNYFENTGQPGASTINYYIYDTGIQTIITSNRFDDYGSTMTSGFLLYLAGSTDGIVTSNRVLDNRPGGAGTPAGIELSIGTWQPNTAGATNWGTYQFVKNGTSFPRLYHPAIQYDLDGNSLSYAPLAKHRDMTFVDVSGGGLKTTNSEYQDAAGRWYYNEAPFANAHVFKPNAATLASGNLTYTVTFTAQCIVGSPYSVSFIFRFTDGAGVATTTTGAFTFASAAAVEKHSTTMVIPVSATMQNGTFAAWLNPLHANTYSISITS